MNDAPDREERCYCGRRYNRAGECVPCLRAYECAEDDYQDPGLVADLFYAGE